MVAVTLFLTYRLFSLLQKAHSLEAHRPVLSVELNSTLISAHLQLPYRLFQSSTPLSFAGHPLPLTSAFLLIL